MGLALAQPSGYEQSPNAVIRAIARDHPDVVQRAAIGKSRSGKPIDVLCIAGKGDVDPDARPALLLVAGVSSMRLVGTDTALGVASALAESANDILANSTVYIVPMVNPDAQTRVRTGDKPLRIIDRTRTRDDADHDGRFDEDPPMDINGDGVITLMRLLDPPPGVEATMMADPDDPRILRPAKPEDGERNRYAVFVEGMDADGDGAIAEDGVGGVVFDRNFPAHWPEFEAGAGTYQLDQPETRALANWMLARDNIAAVLVFGPHDNIVSKQQAGQFDKTGRVPKALEKNDKPYHDAIAKIFKDITGMTKAPASEVDGSFALWAYTHFGVPTFATPVWVRPDLIKRAGEKGEEAGASDAQEAQPKEEERVGGLTIAQMRAMVQEFESADDSQRAGLMQRFRALPQAAQQRIMQLAQGDDDATNTKDKGKRSNNGASAGNASDDAKWLKYSDDSRDGAGFIDWTSFDHPQLGKVEIGGFVPGFKMNPPPEELPRLIDEQTRFAKELVKRLPRVRVANPFVERVGEDVWRVTASVVNDGYLPTISAMGVKTRRLTPIVMQLDSRGALLLSGEPQQRGSAINGSGGTVSSQWLVAGPEGSSVEVAIRSSATGARIIRIPLKDTRAKREGR